MTMRRRAGFTVAVGCLFFVVMRLLSPAFHAGFDGIMLGLTAIAAFALLVLPWHGRRREPEHELIVDGGHDKRAAAASQIRDRVQSLGWSVPEGGVYDALARLARQNPRAAICGAYATITLLIGQAASAGRDDDVRDTLQAMISRKRIQPLQAHTLEDVIEQMDEYCSPSVPARSDTDADMLAAALGTLAFLERAAS